MNKSSFKMRFGAVLILFLLLVASVSATVTINNTSMSTDDSDIVINFEDGWIGGLRNISSGFSINGTYANRWFNDSSDNLNTMIRNSNGNYWATTGANIQLAIDDLNNESGWVEVPAGTHYVTSPIQPTNRSKLFGGGIGATIIKADPGFSDPNAFGIIKGWWSNSYGLHNITVSDMTIDGNYIGGADSDTCITFDNVKNFVIENIHICDSEGGSLRITNGASYGVISHVSVEDHYGLGVGGTEFSHHLSFSDCSVKNSWSYGMDFSNMHDSTVDNMIVEGPHGFKATGISQANLNNTYNNLVAYGNGSTSGAGFKITYTHNCSFSNIFLYHFYNGLSILSNSDYINLNNFYIENSSNIGLSVNGHNVHISNGFVIDSDVYGIDLQGHNITMSNVEVNDATSVSIYLNIAENVKIAYCRILNGGSVGIGCKESKMFSISFCDIVDNTGDGIDTTLGNPNSNYSICYNYFEGNAQGIDCHASDDFIDITHNNLNGDTIDAHFLTYGIIENNIGYDYDQDEIWGEIYIYNNSVATVIHTEDMYHNVTAGVTEGEINGFTYATGNLTATYAGLYHVSLCGSLTGSINKEYHISAGLNAVRQTNIHTEHRMSGADDKVALSQSGFLRLSVGDKVNIMVENVDGTQDITITSANLNLYRIGN